jgi:integrase
MTIDKLPSGKYRVRMMKDKKVYHLTYDYKPTKKEAENDLYALIQEKTEKKNGKLTFEEAAEKYIDSKKNVLSPTTIRSYTVIKRNLSKWFLEFPIDKISQVELNKQVNELALNHSPKTVRNQHGFISAVLGTFRPEMQIYTTLPQKRKIEPYIPSDEDIKKLLEELKETDAYVPIILAAWGMRRGEILALLPSDVEEDGTVHITKSAVYDIDGNLVIKAPKTTESTRDIIIPQEIANIIRERGYVYKSHHQYVTKKMREIQKKLGMQRFTLHKLRHYFASKMLTITDAKTVQSLGGWKTDTVMKTVYAHSMKEEQEKAKRLAVEQLKNTLL